LSASTKLPFASQCTPLGLARSTAYSTPREVSPEDPALMLGIDELPLAQLFTGARMLRDLLRTAGFHAGLRHNSSLMARMGGAALYGQRNTPRGQRGDEFHAFPPRNLAADRPNQLSAANITYNPMRRDFLYLFAVIDWTSRRVLAWRLSNTLTTDFCLDAVRDAIHRYGCLEIVDTDQGRRSTSGEFTGLLKVRDIRISREGKTPDGGRRMLRGPCVGHRRPRVGHEEGTRWSCGRCANAHRSACRGNLWRLSHRTFVRRQAPPSSIRFG